MNRDIFSCYRIILTLISIMVFSGCASMTSKPTSVNCPTVDTSSFQGPVNGTWKGIVMHTAEVSGEFSITIALDGKITGTYSGSISGIFNGCIDNKGNIQASGTVSEGVIAWIGRADKTNGKLSARGTWVFGTGDGIWSGQE